MNLKEKVVIENNIVKVQIWAEKNETPTDDEMFELEMLHNFPKKICIKDIDFSANMKLDNKIPVLTEEEITEDNKTTIELVEIKNINPKVYILDENLDIVFSLDSTRIFDFELGTVFNTKDILAQARVALFKIKIKEKISSILKEIRESNNTFEGEASYTL